MQYKLVLLIFVMEKLKENFQFSFSIDKWEKEIESDTKTFIIVYQVDVESFISNTKWSVPRTIQNMKDVMLNITSAHLNVPIPPKIIDNTDSPEILLSTAKYFEKYLKSILYRSDIINSEIISKFFELENHLRKHYQFAIKTITDITKLKYQVSDIDFNEDESFLFVGCGKKLSINFLDNVLPYKFINFFNKDQLGQILVYRIDYSTLSNNNANIHLLWAQDTKYEISQLKYYSEHPKKYLIVSYYNSTIEIFQCNTNVSSITTAQFLKSIMIIEVSNKKILNFGYNSLTNYIYIVCRKEKDIHATFALSNDKTTNIAISDYDFIGFEYDEKNDNCVLLDEEGKLMICDIEKETKIETKLVYHTNMKDICFFKVDFNQSWVYIGNSNNILIIFSYKVTNNKKNYELYKECTFDLKKRDKSNEEMNLVPLQMVEISYVLYNKKKKELMIAFASGVINFYSHMKFIPEVVIELNTALISKMLLTNQETRLIVSSHDQSVKILALPQYWTSEMTRKYQKNNCNYFLTNEKREECINSLSEFQTKFLIESKKGFTEKYILRDKPEEYNHYHDYFSMK